MAIDEERFRFKGADGVEIAGYRWRASGKAPKAAMVVAHGAAEHALRYKEPLTPLIEAGYAIYAEDHRGHGLTASEAERGKLDAQTVIGDLARLTERARGENAGKPVIFMGHSLGSMMGQGYVLDHHGLIDAFVLSGTLDMITAFSNPRPPAAAFGDKSREKFAWLSRDVAEVDKYVADPLCGFALAPETLASFAPVAQRAGDIEEIKKLPKRLPVYLFVGDEDPINRELAFFTPLVDRYKAAGMSDVTAKVYKGGRHEMLNETNRAEVVADLLAWCDRAIAR